jgi:hypothetical protein
MNHKLLVTAWIALAAAHAQDISRQIWDDYFGKSRPAASNMAAAQVKPQYHLSQPSSRPIPKQSSAAGPSSALGVTVWKLEPPVPGDQARLLVQDPSASTTPVELTPHRMEASERLKIGDRVRITVESPASGYIYVIDQEIRSDGTLGNPYLIFPTTRTRGGDNHVQAGHSLEIPGQTDVPNVFTVRPKTSDESGEKLTIIVATSPIGGLTVSEREQLLDTNTFESWVREWGSETQEFELDGGKGKGWTLIEKQAGQDGARLLTQDDPPPQTVFLFPGRAGKPVIASLNLKVQP